MATLNFSNLYWYDINFFFREFKSYMDFMENYIEKSKIDFESRSTEEEMEKIKTEDEDYYHHLIDIMSERWHEIGIVYPHNFRASFMTQIYSGIESEMRKICSHYHHRMSTPRTAEDMKADNDMARYTKFLRTQAGVDFTNLKTDLEYLNLMRKIRNLITHQEGKITGANRDWYLISKFIAANPDMIEFKEDLTEKDEDGELYYRSRPSYGFAFIINSKKFNSEFLRIAERFFNQLLVHELKFTN